jgi:hypothetical protein
MVVESLLSLILRELRILLLVDSGDGIRHLSDRGRGGYREKEHAGTGEIIEYRSLFGGATTIVTSSGDRESSGLEGTLSLQANSGDIDMSGVSGLRSVATSSGELRVDDGNAQDRVLTGAGAILIDAASASGDHRYRTR